MSWRHLESEITKVDGQEGVGKFVCGSQPEIEDGKKAKIDDGLLAQLIKQYERPKMPPEPKQTLRF